MDHNHTVTCSLSDFYLLDWIQTTCSEPTDEVKWEDLMFEFIEMGSDGTPRHKGYEGYKGYEGEGSGYTFQIDGDDISQHQEEFDVHIEAEDGGRRWEMSVIRPMKGQDFKWILLGITSTTECPRYIPYKIDASMKQDFLSYIDDREARKELLLKTTAS
jgi:hypothetical protein